jgi:gamma-glutamylcyclotransferase (GGCT)/AIG2-like uncharacterized protein YtfP
VNHPIFVYGTLRPGWGNARLWQGRAEPVLDGAVTVTGYRLTSNGGFPYAIPHPGAVTVGCLIVPDDAEYDRVLEQMDWLEGYPHHYDRVIVHAALPEGRGFVEAWLYTPSDPARPARLPAVPGNDWTAAEAEAVV